MMEEDEKVNLTTFGKKKKDQAKRKGNIPIHPSIKKESKCFFSKKKGHMKKDCSKFKIWLDKKGNQFSFVYYESNMVNVNHNIWWIDFGSTIYVSNTLQGMQNLRKPMGSEQYIYSGNKMSSHVEAIRTYSLVLSSGFILELEKTFYVLSFSKNLISISRLVPLGFSFNFSDSGFSLSNKSKVIGSLVLSNGFILELEKTFYVPSFSKNLISISRLVPLGFSFNFSDSGFSLSNKSKVIGYGTLSDGLFHIQ